MSSFHFVEKERVVYIDCDDTLLMWTFDEKVTPADEIVWIEDYGRILPFVPNRKNIEFAQRLKLQGYGVVVWSAAGAAWARTVVSKLGLEDLPDVVLAKPELAMDDLLDAKKIIKSVIWLDPHTGEIKRGS